MVFINLKVLYIFLIFALGCEGSSPICEDINKEIGKDNFGTKTSYFHAYKDQRFWQRFKKESATCSPVKIWFITRHGTRYPVSSDLTAFHRLPKIIEEVVYNHFHGRGCINEEDVFEFKKWVPPYEERDKGQLQSSGFEELFEMGEHWRNLFPEILEEPYDSSKIKVQFTVKNRTEQSAYHFLRGVYGDDEIGKIKLPEPYSPNFILRFYKSCPAWLRDVYRNNETYKEKHLFEETKVFKNMVFDVSTRLGYVDSINLDDLTAIYDECRYESAWFPWKGSIWCKPFSPKDIEVLEYHQDLKYFYEDSYGISMNREIACKTVSDLYSHFKSKVEDPESLPNGVLYFSHDKAIMKIQALLGLFRPSEPLRHDNFDPARRFKTSIVAPFGSNLGFALYRCDGSKYKVSLFFEGNPIHLADVCSDIVCEWNQFEEFMRPIYEGCDFFKTCLLHDEL